MTPVVSILIVTYQSGQDIGPCLDSILAHVTVPFEILIMDMNSRDETAAVVQKYVEQYPTQLYWSVSEKNIGYAGGQQALSEVARAPFLFFLNPDARLTTSTLPPLLRRITSQPSICAVQPAVWLLHSPEQLNLSGKVTQFTGFDFLRDYRSTTVPPASVLDSFSGSGVLVRSDIFKKIGGFDTQYFMYYEDSDLSWRARLAGYTLWFEPTAHLLHDYKYEPDGAQQSLHNKLMYNERNRVATVYKNYSMRSLWLLAPALIFVEAALLGYATLGGWLHKKLAAYAWLLRHREYLREQRACAQSLRRLPDSIVVRNFLGAIEFAHFSHPLLQYFVNPVLKVYWAAVRGII